MSIVEPDTVICTVLANQKITTTRDAVPINVAIRKVNEKNGLRTLNLEGISLGIEAAEAIAKEIAKCPTLENCLWSDCFKGRMLQEIPPALLHLSKGLEQSGAKIKILDLSDNAFGPNGATGVKPMLSTMAMVELEELKLNNCGLGVGGGQIIGAGLEELDALIRRSNLVPKLRLLIAGRNRQEVGGSAALAAAFTKLKSLEEITLHQNGITWQGAVALANCFKVNPKLRVINLNDNILTEKGAMAIAEAIELLPNLEVLDLGDCLCRTDGLLKLASSLTKCPNIRELDFSFSEVRLDAALELLSNINIDQLTKLNLDGNKFGDEGCEEIQEIVGDLLGDLENDEGAESDSENEQAITDSEDEVDYQNVVDKDESLINQLINTGCMKGGVDDGDDDQYEEPLDPASTVDFNMKGMKVDTAADAQPIIDAIESIDRLVTLRLVGNTISPAGAEAISQSLQNRPELQHLLFADIFTGRLKDEIPKAVNSFNQALNSAQARIRTLDLSDNAFGPNGAVAVEPWLNSPCCLKLQILRLNNNGLGVHGGVMIANGLNGLYSLAQDDGVELNLREFICGRNRQEVGGTQALSKALGKIGTLEIIELPQNGILVEGIVALAECIKMNKNLTRLSINDNIVTEKGALAIGKSLESCVNLASLDIGDCLIRNKGAHYLSHNISSLKSLRTLNISYNEIRQDGALAVAKQIITLPVFETINLNGNQLGEIGCELLRAELDLANQGHKLDSLDEDNEPDDDDDEEEVDEIDGETISFDQFKKNPSFESYLQLGKDRDELVINHRADLVAQFAVAIIKDYKSQKSDANLTMDVQNAFHKLLKHMYSTNSEIVATSELLTEVGLLKAMDPERRRRVVDCSDKLKSLYFFLLDEIKKEYFPTMAKKYLTTFFSRPETFKLVHESNCAHRTELVAQLYKF